MSFEATVTPTSEPRWPSSVRYVVLAVVTSMSVLLYLDRFAVTIALEAIREDLRMTQTQLSWFMSAFFWSYALCQVPAGWLSDRFGARRMLTLYILSWSVFTGLMGVAHAVWLLLWLRLFCGIAQAGAYPTAVGLIRHWYPISQRGTASSIVGLGGRVGGVLAPLLTAWLIVYFVTGLPDHKLDQTDILDDIAFAARFDTERIVETKNELDVLRNDFVARFTATRSQPQREALSVSAKAASEKLKDRLQQKSQSPKTGLNLQSVFQDWIPYRKELRQRLENGQYNDLLEQFSTWMSFVECRDLSNPCLKWSVPGKRLLDRCVQGSRLTDEETTRLNRFTMEALFPDDIRKLEGMGWRPTMMLYGILGILIALVFWTIIRNTPQQHSWCNSAERELINDEHTQKAVSLEPLDPSFPWRAFLTDLSLWGNSLTQFLTNVGWLFILSSLPRYLEKVHGVPIVMRGLMTAFPIGAGIFGMLMGGRWTDWAVRHFGLKWGRRIPLVGSRFTAAAGYAICLSLSFLYAPDISKWWLPWIYIAGLCIVSASADFGTPSIWAYCQDVGGRYTASILGWGNMWGNFGAAVAPFLYNMCLGESPTIQNWNAVFTLGFGVFFISGLCAMLLDATKPLTVERSSV